MSSDWEEPIDSEGLTLGPEETLQREIEKSKSLKVEKLQLKDQVEKLQSQVTSLSEKSERLEEEIRQRGGNRSKTNTPKKYDLRYLPAPWVWFLLAFNLAAIGFLLYFQLQK